MASMSPTEIRQYIYDHLDIDATEVPTSVLNLFMADGYNRIIGEFDDSPTFLHVTYTFDSVTGTNEYDLDSTAGLTSPTALQDVADVRGPSWSLRPVSHRQARDKWRQTAPSSGSPNEFSVWGRSLFIWPQSTAATTYTVTGTRKPQDWLTLNAAPDCPEEFHRVLADYALGRTYAQQDDAEMAALYLNAFLPAIKMLSRRYFDGSVAQPVVVNRGSRAEAWRVQKQLGPQIFDWD